MSNIQELIDTANRLSQRLDEAAAHETTFSEGIRLKMEELSYEIFKTANELNEIKYYIG